MSKTCGGRVPNVAGDLSFNKARFEPGTIVEPVFISLPREDAVPDALPRSAQGSNRGQRVAVEIYHPSREVLRFCEIDHGTFCIELSPDAGVLFAQAHPSMNRHHKLGEVFGKLLLDDCMERIVFLPAKEAQTSFLLFPLAYKSSRVWTCPHF